MSAYISTLTKAFLFSAFFFSIGVLYSALAEVLPEAKGPFFYKADKEGKSLYLLGTVHSENLDNLQCRSPIMSFLEDSDLLFTEAEVEMLIQVAKELAADGISADQEFNSLNENSKRSLVDILKSITQNSHSDEKYIAFLQKHNFWYIAMSIIKPCISPETRQHMQREGIPMDIEIQLIADSLIIPQASLDDADDLKDVNLLLGTPFQDHLFTAKDFISLIDDYNQFCNKNKSNMHSFFKSMAIFQNLYQTGETNGDDIEDTLKLQYQNSSLHHSFFDRPVLEGESFKSFKDRLLKKRNQKWIEKIRQSHENNDSVFIGMGLAHLLGSDNILDMQRENDFSIQRMDADCSFNSTL